MPRPPRTGESGADDGSPPAVGHLADPGQKVTGEVRAALVQPVAAAGVEDEALRLLRAAVDVPQAGVRVDLVGGPVRDEEPARADPIGPVSPERLAAEGATAITSSLVAPP